MKRFVLNGALAVLLIFILSACEKEPGSISGKVVDAAGSPVAAATVEVAGTSVLTDEEGNYTIHDIPVGDHTIWATKTGVGNLTSEVTVRAGITTQYDIALLPVND